MKKHRCTDILDIDILDIDILDIIEAAGEIAFDFILDIIF